MRTTLALRLLGSLVLCVTLLACRVREQIVPTPVAVVEAPTNRPALQTREWIVDDLSREAIVAMPNASLVTNDGSPLLFVFHGRGGTARQIRRAYDIEAVWPEAIVVYAQGLKTPGRVMDKEGKKYGWQTTVGWVEDRDLKFFDAMLASMVQDAHADARRVYATGHSNGGGFSYLLWSQRQSVLAAIAPSAASSNAAELTGTLPIMHVAGRKDPLVKFSWQEATTNAVRVRNQCETTSTPVGEHGALYASSVGAPVLLWITDGTHTFDKSCVGPMVTFLKAQRRTAAVVEAPSSNPAKP